ncbi:hypothetical protein GCK32_005682 [Trichostrongylus colubriformis]|uniref:Uncharacterized protein n=1 Tax=Trichostrongylus colubriformis TaxID=6319 RepID=A0AAN8J1W4_TRICO
MFFAAFSATMGFGAVAIQSDSTLKFQLVGRAINFKEWAPSRRPFSLRHDAPVGWLAVDLRQSLLASDEEQLRLLPSPHYKRFNLNDLGQLLTTDELPPVGATFPLYIMARHNVFQRVIAIHIEIVETRFKFYRDHYQTTLPASTANGTMLMFSAPITIKGLSPEQQRLRFAPISSIVGFPIPHCKLSMYILKEFPFQLLTSDELPAVGTTFPLYIMARHNVFQRVIAIHIEIVETYVID